MAPRGLTRDRVVDAAAALADADGLDTVTLAGVADAVGVRTPSLYNHVQGLDGLRRDLTLRGVQEMAARLVAAAGQAAAEGGVVDGCADDRVRAIAGAFRDFARARPGLYGATVRAPDTEDAELLAAADAVVDIIIGALAAYGLEGDRAIHATRALRSQLHGFATLELAGGFGLDVDVDVSFDWMVEAFIAALRTHEPT